MTATDREPSDGNRLRFMALAAVILAVTTLSSCSHRSSVDAFCAKIRSVPTPNPPDALPVSQQIRILEQLEAVAPEGLKPDLRTYRAEAEVIAGGHFKGTSFPPS